MFPAAVRQRRVELDWRHGSLDSEADRDRPSADAFTRTASTGSSCRSWTPPPTSTPGPSSSSTRAGPATAQMIALWTEGGYLLELRAAVPDLAAFEERLGWLTKVDSQTWLDAMPAKVVKAADHDAAVREMLKGIPVPKTFKPSRIPDEGLTTDRYQVGAQVTGTVSCLWFRQWGEARRTGDAAAQAEAEKAMATSRHWPILREMAKDDGRLPRGDLGSRGGDAAAATGNWAAMHTRPARPRRRPRLRPLRPPAAAEKKRQRERGVPPPPDSSRLS